MRTCAFWCSLSLLILASAPAFAWGNDGHKIICEIAYRNLVPTAKKSVDDLIAADGRFSSFPESCPWPDTIGTDPAYDAKPSWHYLNMRRDDPTVDEGDCDPVRHCVLFAINTYEKRLKDKNLSPKKRAEALEFLSHFVADVHQPMHVSFGDDQGGNKVRVLWLSGEPTNLHFVWDFVAIETEERDQWAFLPPDQRWRRYADKLTQAVTIHDRKTWTGGTPVGWAQESYDLTRSPDLKYANAKKSEILTLGWDYFYRARAIIDQRLEAASIRLATILNGMFNR